MRERKNKEMMEILLAAVYVFNLCLYKRQEETYSTGFAATTVPSSVTFMQDLTTAAAAANGVFQY